MTNPNPTPAADGPDSAGDGDPQDLGHDDPQHDPAADPHGDPDDDTSDQADDQDTGGPIAEARRYRRRAQAAEAERDELRSQLDALTSQLTAIRQAEVDNIARAEGLRNPALLSGDHPLESFITDEGTVDREAVTAAVHVFMDDNGIQRRLPGIQPNPLHGFNSGNGGGGRTPAGSWKGAIDGARNG